MNKKIQIKNKPIKKVVKTTTTIKKSPKLMQPKMTIHPMVADFVMALKRPFDPSTEGCRVPDPWSFPTTTYHLHQTLTMGNSSTNAPLSGLFLPSPLVSTIDLSLAASGSSLGFAFATSSQTQITTGTGGLTGLVTGASTETALSGLMSSYRVVSWGIRLSNLIPELSAAGRVIVAYIPINPRTPGPSVLSSSANQPTPSNIPPIFINMPASVADSSTVLELPTAQEFSFQDLLSGNIEIPGVYTNPSFFTFRNSFENTNWNGGEGLGDQIVDKVATGTIGSYGSSPSADMTGGVGIIVYIEGVPTGLTSVLQVEVIYHLEGTPQIGSNTATVPIPSSSSSLLVGPPTALESALTMHRPDSAMRFLNRAQEFIRKTSNTVKAISSGARTVANHPLTKAAMRFAAYM
jgi:hypothetical protein